MDAQKLNELVNKLKELSRELGKTPTYKEFVASGVSKRVFDKIKFSELCRLAGLEPNKYAQNTDPVESFIRPPRILIFDLEVCAAKAYTYEFRDAYIPPDQIIEMPYILSYSAKFLDSDEIFYLDTRFSPKNDEHILEALSYLIEQADYLVGHNMARFDLKMTKSRIAQHEKKVIKDVPVFDTFKIAYKHFKFPFYKLGALAKYLNCVNEKLTHSKFPGNLLFIEADKGNIEAFNEMEEYCKQDVRTTEEVFKKLMPWESSINFSSNYQKRICSCGSENFFKNGFKYTRTSTFQIYRCSNCHKTFTDKNNLIDKDIKKGFLK